MTITTRVKRLGQSERRYPSIGPQAGFVAAVMAAGAAMLTGFLPGNLLMPAVSVMLFVLAMVFALVAWIRCSTDEYAVTYWDVAGAVAFIGICTAALVEPDQLVRLVAGASSEK
jgi:hypothetical protein